MLADQNNQLVIAYKLSQKDLQEEIDRISAQSGIMMIPVDSLSPDHGLPVLRVTKKGLLLEDQGQPLFFHPSMALLRMINIRRGIGDRFLQAMEAREGDTVLDATMGLASDALIASWAVGGQGKILAIEASPLIHLLVKEGLASIKKLRPTKIAKEEKKQAWTELTEAALRIETFCGDHQRMLAGFADNSVDIVYFDPMFRRTFADSSSIRPIKNWSNAEPLQIETIREAQRVARRRLVLKERRTSGEFLRLGFKAIESSPYTPVNYGFINLMETGGCSP